MATSVIISQLPPPPNETGSGVSKGTDLFPATDITDTSSATTGTTKKYTLSEIYNFILNAEGLATYQAVRVATTGALSVTYTNGTLGVGAQLTNAGAQAPLSIDGVTLSVGDRVLVQNQVSQLQNGIYNVTSVGSIGTNWIMTRSTDYDTSAEIIQYGVILSNQGILNAGKLWQEIGAGPFSIGTTAIIFAAYTSQSITFPVTVPQGGTGVTSFTPYAILAGGTTSTSAMQQLPVGTAGQLLQSLGSASLADYATLAAGSGIHIANITGSITISSTGGGIGWVGISGTSQAAAINTGYIVQNAGQTTITLPAVAAIGDTISVRGLGAAGWVILPGSGQSIQALSATAGTSITSSGQYDSIDFTCIVANTLWTANNISSLGLTIA